jgi:hypothetical protein
MTTFSVTSPDRVPDGYDGLRDEYNGLCGELHGLCGESIPMNSPPGRTIVLSLYGVFIYDSPNEELS